MHTVGSVYITKSQVEFTLMKKEHFVLCILHYTTRHYNTPNQDILHHSILYHTNYCVLENMLSILFVNELFFFR